MIFLELKFICVSSLVKTRLKLSKNCIKGIADQSRVIDIEHMMEREQMRIADEDGIRDDQTVKWNFEMVVGIVQSSGV